MATFADRFKKLQKKYFGTNSKGDILTSSNSPSTNTAFDGEATALFAEQEAMKVAMEGKTNTPNTFAFGGTTLDVKVEDNKGKEKGKGKGKKVEPNYALGEGLEVLPTTARGNKLTNYLPMLLAQNNELAANVSKYSDSKYKQAPVGGYCEDATDCSFLSAEMDNSYYGTDFDGANTSADMHSYPASKVYNKGTGQHGKSALSLTEDDLQHGDTVTTGVYKDAAGRNVQDHILKVVEDDAGVKYVIESTSSFGGKKGNTVVATKLEERLADLKAIKRKDGRSVVASFSSPVSAEERNAVYKTFTDARTERLNPKPEDKDYSKPTVDYREYPELTEQDEKFMVDYMNSENPNSMQVEGNALPVSEISVPAPYNEKVDTSKPDNPNQKGVGLMSLFSNMFPEGGLLSTANSATSWLDDAYSVNYKLPEIASSFIEDNLYNYSNTSGVSDPMKSEDGLPLLAADGRPIHAPAVSVAAQIEELQRETQRPGYVEGQENNYKIPNASDVSTYGLSQYSTEALTPQVQPGDLGYYGRIADAERTKDFTKFKGYAGSIWDRMNGKVDKTGMSMDQIEELVANQLQESTDRQISLDNGVVQAQEGFRKAGMWAKDNQEMIGLAGSAVAPIMTSLINRRNLGEAERIDPTQYTPSLKSTWFNSAPMETAFGQNFATTADAMRSSTGDFSSLVKGLTQSNYNTNLAMGQTMMEGQKLNMAEQARIDSTMSDALKYNAGMNSQADIDQVVRQDNLDRAYRGYTSDIGTSVGNVFTAVAQSARAKEIEKLKIAAAKLS